MASKRTTKASPVPSLLESDSPAAAPAAAPRASRPAKATQSKPATADDAGRELERRVARIEFAEGAYVRVRTPVRAPEAELGRRVLTDVDVLSLDTDMRLRVTMGITECKTERGQSGEVDRLFWLAGLKQFVGAEHATLCRPTASSRGVATARSLGLRFLDDTTLARREGEHAWVPERFGHIDGESFTALSARADQQIKALPDFPSSLKFFVEHESLTVSPHRALNGLISLGHHAVDAPPLPSPARELLAGHALVCLVVAALRDAGSLDVLPVEEMRQRLRLALTVGNPFDSHLLDVLTQADTLVAAIVEDIHLGYAARRGTRVDVEVPSLRQLVGDPPEAEIDAYLGLVTRFRSLPSIARDLPQTVELVCFEALIGGKEWMQRCFDHLFTSEHGNLLAASVRTLQTVAGQSLAEALNPTLSLNFARSAPAVPDRRSPPAS